MCPHVAGQIKPVQICDGPPRFGAHCASCPNRPLLSPLSHPKPPRHNCIKSLWRKLFASPAQPRSVPASARRRMSDSPLRLLKRATYDRTAASNVRHLGRCLYSGSTAVRSALSRRPNTIKCVGSMATRIFCQHLDEAVTAFVGWPDANANRESRETRDSVSVAVNDQQPIHNLPGRKRPVPQGSRTSHVVSTEISTIMFDCILSFNGGCN